MFRKRYLTIQETIDANARTISISVVKFIVKVKLVEKRANRTVGNVIVVNVMIQINIPGITLAIANRAPPSNPSHEVDGALSRVTFNAEVA